MTKYLSKRFAGMQPYVPGEQPQDKQYVKLNTNESPFPPSLAVIAALSAAELQRLNLYPDPDTKTAAEAIAAYYGLRRENILLGNGSDEILAFCFQAFCDQTIPAVYADITYGFYQVFARLYGILSKVIPLEPDLSIRPDRYYTAGGTIFLANPNAPTGSALDPGDIEQILQQNRDTVVVVDEAYISFGGSSALPLIQQYENLLVVRTMSKDRNLAGMRLGYALGNPMLIADLNQMKFSFNPYNVNRLSLLAAMAAVQDEAYFLQCTGAIRSMRAAAAEALRQRGFTVLPSSANFLFAKPNRMSGEQYYRKLKARGVLVRYFSQPRIADYVRITIGTQAEMQRLLDETDEIWRQP